MKTPKRSIEREEASKGSSTELDTEPDDLDEEVIELEEIVEFHAGDVETDDEVAFDAAILDADAGPDLRDFEGRPESEEELFLEDDLLKEFGFLEDRQAEPEPIRRADMAEEKPEEFTFGRLLDDRKEIQNEAEREGEASISEEIMPEVVASPVEAPAKAIVPLDDFVAEIEKRLLETIREMVESRLPEIVRMVLKEEIERLKSDSSPEA